MAEHNDLGRWGELTAAKYLIDMGYNILERNYRHKRGELDIIARKSDGSLRFVEVKTRTNQRIDATESVDQTKLNLLMETASYYKETHFLEEEGFFDIVVVCVISTDNVQIDVFEDIWIYD